MFTPVPAFRKLVVQFIFPIGTDTNKMIFMLTDRIHIKTHKITKLASKKYLL